jgi:hypothetical protein
MWGAEFGVGVAADVPSVAVAVTAEPEDNGGDAGGGGEDDEDGAEAAGHV